MMTPCLKNSLRIAAVFGLMMLVFFGFQTTARAQTVSGHEPNICVFDLLGAKGPIFNLAQEYALEGRKNGYGFKPVVYTNESIATKDFEIGVCDGLVATGIRTRKYNSFTGSLDAVGGLPNYDAVLLALKSMGSPQLQPVMQQSDFEVGGVLPFGTAYVFVRDREINSSNYGSMFNNGAVDIIVAPSIAYSPLELYKGLGKKGAIIQLPVAMVTYQIILRKSKFQPGSGQKLRAFVAQEMPKALNAVKKIDRQIPDKAWLKMTDADKLEYTTMMREARISLSKDGVYDGCALRLLKKVRCSLDGKASECSLPEGYTVPKSCPIQPM
jgi:hypothetical protein